MKISENKIIRIEYNAEEEHEQAEMLIEQFTEKGYSLVGKTSTTITLMLIVEM